MPRRSSRTRSVESDCQLRGRRPRRQVRHDRCRLCPPRRSRPTAPSRCIRFESRQPRVSRAVVARELSSTSRCRRSFPQIRRSSTRSCRSDQPSYEVEKQDAVGGWVYGRPRTRTRRCCATVYHQRIKNNIWFLPMSFYGPGIAAARMAARSRRRAAAAFHVYRFVNLGERPRPRRRACRARGNGRCVAFQGSYTFQDVPQVGQRNQPAAADQ